MPSKTPYRTQSLTLDLVLHVLHRTILHPFIAWLIPLCLRAQATPYSHPSFTITIAYAILVTGLSVLGIVNRRVAYGTPRNVDLSEEVIVVTGGASGLGLLIAEIYGMRGVSVAVLDVKQAGDGEGKGTDSTGWREMHGVEYYQCDVANRAQVEEMAKRIEADLGTPTVLINCAAAAINGLPLLSLHPCAIAQTIETNLLSHFHTLQVFLPGMLASSTGGTIVSVSSVLGYLPAAGLSDYTATKAAITAVHRTLEAELRLSGDDERVKTLLVETGQMATRLFEDIETPNNFFAPVLEPVQVAREIVSAIDSGTGGVIRLPAFAALVDWYGVLPAGIQRILRFLSGIDTAVGKATFIKKSEEERQVLLSTRGSDSDRDLVNVDK